MKPMRPLVLMIVLLGVVYFLTNRGPRPSLSQSSTSVTRPEHVELAEASGPLSLDAEEQLNVTVYKKALPSVVNITSTQVTFDFFYGAVPPQGPGWGFVLAGQGHILTNYHA